MQKNCQMKLLGLAILLVWISERTVSSFSLRVSSFSLRAATTTTTTTKRPLFARKASKSKKSGSKRPSAAAGGGGGGFGAATATATSGGVGISGHAGSGTKALRKAANNFDRIRQEQSSDDDDDNKDAQTWLRDVYVRSPLNSATTFWFVGKIAREPNQKNNDGNDSDDNDDNHAFFAQAAVAQKRLILDYSRDQLRPQNFGGKRYSAALELWLAPGNSEMDVATNKVALTKVVGSAADLMSLEDFDFGTVGYNPEIYVGDEVTKGGLRVERDEHGVPTKPVFDVNQSM